MTRSVDSWLEMFTGMNDLEKAAFIINDLIGYRVNTSHASRTEDVESVRNALRAMQQITATEFDTQITEEAMSMFTTRVRANMMLVRIELSDKGVDLEDVMKAIHDKNYKAFNDLMTVINAKGDAP